MARRKTIIDNAPKIISVNINDRIVSGIQFAARNTAGRTTVFFWSPSPENFAKWLGHGWQLLPIDRLPPAKRQKLMHLWKNRGDVDR